MDGGPRFRFSGARCAAPDKQKASEHTSPRLRYALLLAPLLLSFASCKGDKSREQPTPESAPVLQVDRDDKEPGQSSPIPMAQRMKERKMDETIEKVKSEINSLAKKLDKTTKGKYKERSLAALSSISRSPYYRDGVRTVLRLIVDRAKGQAAAEALEAFNELLRNPKFDKRLFPAAAFIARTQKQGTIGTSLYILNELIKQPQFDAIKHAKLMKELFRGHPLRSFLKTYARYKARPDVQAMIKSSYRNFFLWLGQEIDRLSRNPRKRDEFLRKKIPRQIGYFILGEASEVYTTSFNRLFNRLGLKKPMEDIAKLDPNKLYLPGFLLKASYFGRFSELVPESKKAQKNLIDDLFKVASLSEESKYFVADVFSYISTMRERKYWGFKYRLHQEIIGRSGRFAEGLFLILYHRFGAKAREKFKDRYERLLKRYRLGPFWRKREIPSGWLKVQAGEMRPTIRAKLYFHKEWPTDNPNSPVHLRLCERFLSSKGFSKRVLDGKARGEKKGDIVMSKTVNGVDLLYILSYAGNLDLENDMKDPSIDWIAHRGHSYQALMTFSRTRIKPMGKLVFLGSCGGYSAIPELYERFGFLPIIATKNIGAGKNNNAILYHLALALSRKEKVWSRLYKQTIWKSAVEKGVDRKLLRYYVFPGNPMETMYRILNAKIVPSKAI
jgi:hypothetical protein